MDARIDGMLYAAIQHPPVLGSKVKTFDDKGPLQVKGVQKVIPLDTFNSAPAFQPLGGVAMVADNAWAAFQGRKKLNATWENSAHATYNSDEFKKDYRRPRVAQVM